MENTDREKHLSPKSQKKFTQKRSILFGKVVTNTASNLTSHTRKRSDSHSTKLEKDDLISFRNEKDRSVEEIREPSLTQSENKDKSKSLLNSLEKEKKINPLEKFREKTKGHQFHSTTPKKTKVSTAASNKSPIIIRHGKKRSQNKPIEDSLQKEKLDIHNDKTDSIGPTSGAG